jgi:hypothetical protein
MKIIFDEENIKRDAIRNNINPPESLVEEWRNSLKKLGEFIGADSIEYVDEDRGEQYLITKGDNTLVLEIMATRCDGGWMNIYINGE